MDAIVLLKDDHKLVAGLFRQFEKTKDTATPAAKKKLVDHICSELVTHAYIEETNVRHHLEEEEKDPRPSRSSSPNSPAGERPGLVESTERGGVAVLGWSGGGMMTVHLQGSFTLESFDENPIELYPDGTKITRARIVTALSGGVDGVATADNVMLYAADGTARIVGFQRVVGRIGDRSGSFTVRTVGGYDGDEATHDAVVVTGDGGFAGVTGAGTAAAPHGPNGTYTFDLDLPPAD